MVCSLVSLLAFGVLFMQTDGLLTPRELPVEMAKCLNKFYKTCTIEDEVGLSILHSCIQEYKWKPNSERQYPEKRLSPEGLRYLQGLTRKVQARRGGARGRRQASGVNRRKEYRMLSDSERARYHNALRRLKESTVSILTDHVLLNISKNPNEDFLIIEYKPFCLEWPAQSLRYDFFHTHGGH